MKNINSNTSIYGLIGNPIEHSLSPFIHNYLAEKLNINMIYIPLKIEKGDLQKTIKNAKDFNFKGFNITVPYKEEIISYINELDKTALNINSVNTLIYENNKYKGYNTDISGLYRALSSDGISLKDEKVIIIGAGGVGRTVCFMCAQYGAKKIYLLNRTLEKALNISNEINNSFNKNIVKALNINDYNLLIDNNYIVFQCTNIGLYPNNKQVVINDDDFYKKISIGYDLIYNPYKTLFMKLVSKEGGKSFNGLKMLLYQAIDSFELWNNCKVPEEIVNELYILLQEEVLKFSLNKKEEL